jgi:hypothetical protein
MKLAEARADQYGDGAEHLHPPGRKISESGTFGMQDKPKLILPV